MKALAKVQLLAVAIVAAQAATLAGFGAENRFSPDGKVAITFTLQTDGTPAYSIASGGKQVVLESRLGFEPDFTNGFTLVDASRGSHRGQWTNEFGERRIVPDIYREMEVFLNHKSGRQLRILFRAYDEGVALRYTFTGAGTNEFKFSGERTEFRFPQDTYGYEEHGTEGEYRRVKVGDIKPWCERPLTLEFAGGGYASLGEAANTNFPRMLLSALDGVSNALVSALGGTTANTDAFRQRHDPSISLRGGESSPWRFLVAGNKPGELLERNYVVLNLNAPNALADTSWIKPGKVMRDTTLTTTNSKAIIDFAAKAGLQYVLLDARWYGSEEAATGDATTNRAPNLDVQEIIRYGRDKGVRLILYVDRRQVEKQRDIIFPLYEKWGVAGVKLGFVNVGPQSETAWISETIAKAAEHHLMLNIHDGYRATGNNRTWPNLMTVEGIRGNEHWPTPEHDCTLPFTRYVGGIGDYTVCYYDKRLRNTHAHQLAMAVVSFSPLQCLFWYDSPGNYHDEPEIEFFRQVPTVWDETKVVQGEIGKFATIARRSGADWFVGTVNNSEARTLPLALNFLERGKEYVAHVYSDDDSVATRTKVGVATRNVNSDTVLQMTLKPAGGQAVWITPATAR
jgi:alpha-glucosidase